MRFGVEEQVGCARLSGRGSGSDAFVREEEVPSLLSFKGGGGGAVSKATALMRWFKTPVTLCVSHDFPAASSRQPGPRHVFASAASSHGPLTACVDACRWRAH
jgi:hypothetical protein